MQNDMNQIEQTYKEVFDKSKSLKDQLTLILTNMK